MKKMKRIFSGIQPSGQLHIGNYIGAIKQWVAMQDAYECFYCIVDLHAITVAQDPKALKQKTRELAALYLACGIDPDKSTVFIQSHNPDHASLAWILDCITPMGLLSRMTQYKSKSEKLKGQSTVGLFNYPVLMAADILLYDTDLVPVGEDQKQHVELTRDLAEKFNSRFGPVFKIPEVKMFQLGARIMSLKEPDSKMSKSDSDPDGVLDLLDEKQAVVKKIKSATTDSGSEIKLSYDKPGISNLLTIYSHLSGIKINELEQKYQGRGYGDFKADLAEVVINFLAPIQKKYQKLISDKAYLDQILTDGAKKARSISRPKMKQVNDKVGLG